MPRYELYWVVIEKPPGGLDVYRAVSGPHDNREDARVMALLRQLYHEANGKRRIVLVESEYTVKYGYYNNSQAAMVQDIIDQADEWAEWQALASRVSELPANRLIKLVKGAIDV